jgi:hypothetical protein
MRTIILFICLLLFSFAIKGQTYKIAAKVIDSDSGEVLPFVNIVILNHTIGTTSDINGFFELVLDDTLKRDTLVFSYVGYQPLKVFIYKLDTLVKLNRRVINLQEIVVTPHKNRSKRIVINSFKKNKCSIKYNPVNDNDNSWFPYRPKEPAIEAMYFPFKDEYKYKNKIKEIWIYLTSFNIPVNFRLRIFNSSSKHFPAEDLLNECLNIKVDNYSKAVKIKLDKYNLNFPEHGMFVGVELLIIPENSKIIKTKEGNSITLYSPYLNYISTKEPNYYYWLYSKGKWFKNCEKVPNYTSRNKNLFYKPAISLFLTE